MSNAKFGYCPCCDKDTHALEGRCTNCFNHLLKPEYNPRNIENFRGYNPTTKQFKTRSEAIVSRK